jgi:hypothetical protein
MSVTRMTDAPYLRRFVVRRDVRALGWFGIDGSVRISNDGGIKPLHLRRKRTVPAARAPRAAALFGDNVKPPLPDGLTGGLPKSWRAIGRGRIIRVKSCNPQLCAKCAPFEAKFPSWATPQLNTTLSRER